MRELIIIGAGGHGKVAADIAKLNGYEHIMFLDDDGSIHLCSGYDVVGRTEDYKKYLRRSDFFVAIGNAPIREQVIEEIESDEGIMTTLVHPDAVIAAQVEIGSGTVVMAGAVINPGSRIGMGCIVNTSSSIDHDCVVGNYCHIAVGAHLAGTVNVGNGTWIGAGAIVSNNVNICGGCMIGAGAVVIKNIDEAGIYIGVPAEKRISTK